MFLEISQNSQVNTGARVSFLIKCSPYVCNCIKKETLAQVFSCEFREISKNTSGRLLLHFKLYVHGLSKSCLIVLKLFTLVQKGIRNMVQVSYLKCSTMFWTISKIIFIKHCVKRIRNRSCSVGMRENTDRNNSEYGHI